MSQYKLLNIYSKYFRYLSLEKIFQDDSINSGVYLNHFQNHILLLENSG